MGLALSTNVSKDVTEIVTKNLISNSSECTASALNSINIAIKSGGDIVFTNVKTDQKNKTDLRCIASSSNDIEVSNKIRKDLEQFAKTKMEGLNIFQAGASTNINEVVGRVANEVKIDDVKRNIASALSKVNIDLTTDKSVTFNDVSFIQSNEVLNESVSSVVNKSSAINELQSKISQAASVELVGLFSMGMIALIIIGMIVWFTFKKKSPTSSLRGPPVTVAAPPA